MKIELSYTAIFTSAVILTAAVLWSLANNHQIISTDEIITSCRQVSDSLLSSRFHIQNILGFALTGLMVKALFSFGKTYSKLGHLQKYQAVKAPAKLQKLLDHYRLNQDQIVIIKYGQKLAMTLGIRQPKIILSTELIQLLSPKQLEAVLLHELYHLEHAHPALFIWGELVSSTLFFLPSLDDLLQKMKSELESKADEFAVQSQQTSRFLKQAVIKSLSDSRNPALALAPGFVSQVLEQRVAALTDQKSNSPFVFDLKKMAITLLVIGVALGLLYKPTTIQAETQQTRNQSKCGFLQCVSSCVQEELMSKSGR